MKLKKVLIIEDEIDVSESIKSICECAAKTLEMEIEIKTVSNGTEALQIICDWKPNLCTLDISIPGMAGDKILKILHQELKMFFPVIMITGSLDKNKQYCECLKICKNEPNKLTYCDANVVLLSKPFDAKYLKLLLSKFLKNGAV